MCTTATLMHAAEMMLPLITAAAVRWLSWSAHDGHV